MGSTSQSKDWLSRDMGSLCSCKQCTAQAANAPMTSFSTVNLFSVRCSGTFPHLCPTMYPYVVYYLVRTIPRVHLSFSPYEWPKLKCWVHFVIPEGKKKNDNVHAQPSKKPNTKRVNQLHIQCTRTRA